MTTTKTDPKKTTQTDQREPEPRNLVALLTATGGSVAFHAPYAVAEAKALWDALRAEYDTVIEPDQHSEHYVRLRFTVEGVPVAGIFYRKDVGVRTTVTAERYTIEGELTA